MNNNRLFTYKLVNKNNNINRKKLLEKINNILKGPSNFKIINEKLFIISLNKYYHSSRLNKCVIIIDQEGNKLHSFHSLVECATFLNVHSSTISKRKTKNISFIFENKIVYIKEE